MKRKDKIAWLRKIGGKQTGQSFTITNDLKVYVTGSKSTATDKTYMIGGPVGATAQHNLKLYTPQQLWDWAVEVATEPVAEVTEADAQAEAATVIEMVEQLSPEAIAVLKEKLAA